jgi:outer membrane protein assembly factor BamB
MPNSFTNHRFLRCLFLFIFAGSLIALQGCQGNKRRLAAELTPINNPVNLDRVWSVSLGKSVNYVLKPILIGSDIYANSEGGNIYRIDAASGKVIWNVSAPKGLSTGPGTDGNTLVVGSLKGDIYAFDAQTGAKKWDTSVGTEVLTEPLVAAGVVVIRTIDNRFIGLEAASGKRRWVMAKNPSVLSLRASYSMSSINNEVIFTGFSGGQFGLMALSNGNTIWESLLAPPRGTSEIERLSDITSKPTLLGQRMCAVSYQGKIGCGDIKNARMAWVKDFSSFSGTTQSADAVYAVNDKSFLAAFNANQGTELWRNEKLQWRDVGEPLAVGSSVLAGDSQGYLHVFAQSNGDIVGRVRVDSTGIPTAPIATQGLVIVQTKGGTLAAYKIQ